MIHEQKDIRWPFVLCWVLASFGGWVLFVCLIFGVWMAFWPFLRDLPQASNPFPVVIFGTLLGTLAGAPIGVLQWLVLRGHIARGSWWLVATAIGLFLGTAMGTVTLLPAITDASSGWRSWAFVLPAILVPGIVVALAQHLVLQRQFRETWRWIIPSGLSWPVPLFAYMGFFGDESLVGLLLTMPVLGSVLALISGVSLIFISKNRREMEPPQGQQQVSPRRVNIQALFNIMVHVAIVALLIMWVLVIYFPAAKEVSARRPILTLTGHTAGVTNLAFSPDSTLLASASMDGTVGIWNTENGDLLRTVEHRKGEPVLSVSFGADGVILASGTSADIKLWHVADGTLLRTLPGAGRAIALSPDGLELASVRMSGLPGCAPPQSHPIVTLWRVADGKSLWSLEAGSVGSYNPSSLVFSSDGAMLAVGFNDDANSFVSLWQVEDGATLNTLTYTYCSGTRIAFSPDGRTLAAGSNDHIHLWRVEDGASLRDSVLRVAAGPYTASPVAFSSDGTILASVRVLMDGYRVYFWRTVDGRLLQTLFKRESTAYPSPLPPTGIGKSFAFSPDLKMMATDGPNGAIRIYGFEGPPIAPVPPPSIESTSPVPVSPEEGAELDNGRVDRRDDIIWDFNWYELKGATEYNLYIVPPEPPRTQRDPLNFTGLTSSSYHYVRRGYITGADRFGWSWKVRAKVDGRWTNWSETRTFDVEPINSDPPS